MSNNSVKKEKHLFGLIGFPLSHSFSKKYFSDKFENEERENHAYELFPMEKISELPNLIAEYPNLKGLNVTIPHKQAVLPLLHEVDKEAEAIGAVNVIQIKGDKWIGYNSDVYGFEHSLRQFLGADLNLQALVLGTGGASKAVLFVLKKLGIPAQLVSRKKKDGQLTYEELDDRTMEEYRLLINTTPLGTFPEVDSFPDLPYSAIRSQHYLYDLVYNPAETVFLKKGKACGAHTINGLEMLHLQAERAWEIWNEKSESLHLK